MLTRRSLICAATASLLVNTRAVNGQENGRYIGRVLTEWLGDDNRSMRLVEPFEFVDTNGMSWPVPAGTVVDGASIPKVFWSIIGGPFEGAYRNASVIHDYYCDSRSRNYEEVHQVFYDGMNASGVEPSRSWLMYQAVAKFGPRWPKVRPGLRRSKPPMETPRLSKKDLQEFINQQKNKASAEDIAALNDIAQSM